MSQARGGRGPARARPAGAGAPDQYEHVQRQRCAYQDALGRTIEEGAAAGELHVDDPRLATLAVLVLVNSSKQWFDEGVPRTIEQVGDAYVELAVGRLLGATMR